MSGIPVYTASPINANTAAKPSGVTPSTAAAQYAPTSTSAAATTTTTPSTTSASQARPGAPGMPQPTGGVNAPSQSTPQPTRTYNPPTSTSSDSNPPPPQPGAVPSPYRSAAPPTTSTPPAPQPSIISQPPVPTQTATSAFPPTAAPISLPPHQQSPNLLQPQRAQPPASTTSNFSHQHDLSHPPGYQQDTKASFEDKPVDHYNTFENKSTPHQTSGILGGGTGGGQAFGEEMGVWDTAVSWAKAAGQKLQEGEAQVWKTINGEK